MNETNPDLKQNAYNNTPTLSTLSGPPGGNPAPASKLSKKLLLIVCLGLLLVVGIVALVAFIDTSRGTNNNHTTIQKSVKPQPIEQVFVSPVDGTKTQINKDDYYAVTVGQNPYYGTLHKINDDYIRLSPTAYKKEGAVVLTGGELHGPETTTFFKVSQVTALQKLDTANKDDIRAIETLKSTTAQPLNASLKQDIDEYIKKGQLQAYFFADGSAFFARTTTLQDTFLAGSSRVYVLQSATNVSLAVAKPEQYNQRTTKDLLYWQNMRADSQISKAVTDFEAQN